MGAQAEAAARTFLEGKGFHFLVANYRSRRGEIDLIMRQGELLVFAEVRLRNQTFFGGAAASVTYHKQQKIIACAKAFLQHHPQLSQLTCRFDVLAMQLAGSHWQIEWLSNAFYG